MRLPGRFFVLASLGLAAVAGCGLQTSGLPTTQSSSSSSSGPSSLIGCAHAQRMMRTIDCGGDPSCVANAGVIVYGEIATPDGRSRYASVDGCVAANCLGRGAYVEPRADVRVLYGFVPDACTDA
jgi:hypothetical protein